MTSIPSLIDTEAGGGRNLRAPVGQTAEILIQEEEEDGRLKEDLDLKSVEVELERERSL